MRWFRPLLRVAGGLVLAGLLLFAGLQTPVGQRWLAAAVSSLASTPDRRIEVAGLAGFFPTDLTIAKVELADRQGVWLEVGDAAVRWSFASLLDGRLRIESLSARRLEVMRPPLPDAQPSAKSSSGGGLPLGIDLNHLSVDDLHVGAALGGIDSRWKLAGSLLLTADRTQSRLKLEMTRSDGPTARAVADFGFDLERFDIDGEVTFSEDKQGVVAALLGRPDLDRVSARLLAKGDRSEGKVDLTVGAGDAVTSEGTARWHREGAETAVSLRLGLAGPGLPDSSVARLLRAPVVLTGEATLDDAGLLIVKQAALEAGPVRLTATARYDTARDRLEATSHLESAEAGALADLAGGTRWRNLRLDATAELTNLAKAPQGTVSLAGSADDLAFTGLGERAPPPGRLEMKARLGVLADGRLVVESFDAATPLAVLKASGRYSPSSEDGEGKLIVDLPDLAPLSRLAGLPLTGRGHLELAPRLQKDGVTVDWQGTLEDLGLPGLPPGLARQALRLSGSAALQGDQSWRLDRARFASDDLGFEMSGRGRAHAGEIDLSLDLPKLGVLQSDVGGAASAKGKLTLKPSGGDLHVDLDLSDLKRGGIASRKLAVVVDAALEGDSVRGSVTTDGDLANQPLALAGRFARSADGGLQVPSVRGRWASGWIDIADLAITPKGATGSGHLEMARLTDLAPLLGTDLAGALELDVTTEPDPAGKVQLALQARNLKSGPTGVGALQVDATLSDPFGAATADATIKAGRVSGLADIDRLNATVKGDRTALDIALQAIGARTNASLAAKVEPVADEIRVTLQRFDGRHQGVPLVLGAPARIRLVGERVTIEPAGLRLGGGRLGVRGVVDPVASDLTLEVAGLPLSLIDAFAPGSGVEGTLQSTLRITGPSVDPRIQATYAANGLRLKRPETALLPALALKGTASVVDRQATFDARMTAGGATSLAIKGQAAIPQGNAPINASASVTGQMDLAPFSPALGTGVRAVTGTLRPDVTLNVSNGAMTGNGSVSLAGAALYLPASGLRLSGGEGSLSLQGDTLRLQRLAFQTASNGQVSATGTIRLDPKQGFPVDLAVTTRRALLVTRPDLIATASMDLKVAGSSSAGFDVAGPVTIDRAEIAIGVSQAGSYPIVAVREINGSGPANQSVASPPPPSSAPGALPVRLALNVQAPQAVFVRGRGLNAEVGGQFTVTGNPAAPAVLGNLSLRRGDFALVGHRLNFKRGNVSLVSASTIDPLLDFAATTTVNATTIEVDITGTSRAPKIELTSSPALPQDEAMALLLFGKPSTNLSPFELLSAAQALAELTGRQPAGGFMARLRGGLGLDQLSINSGGTGGTTTSVEGGRYVAPGVYVGARQGASGDSSRGVVEIEVFKHTKIQGDIGADSNGKVGAKMEWDY